MKRIWNHPDVKSDRRYWRSLGEYAQTPEFTEKVGREFDPALATMSEEERDSSRRDFMKIMGGVAAMAGLASCRRPIQTILPFTKHVEWIIPGKALLYATVMPRSWGATPVVAITHEGRPTHLQPNPLHPNSGGLDIFAQASVLDLYNADRVKDVRSGKKTHSWTVFQKEMRGWWEKSWQPERGAGLALLINPGTSPTRAALLKDFAKTYPQAKVYSYEPVHRNAEAAAVKALLGEGVSLVPVFAKADRVFSLDCDFLGLDAVTEAGVKDFMRRRAPEKAGDEMNRLYVLENRYTVTGGVSDHRKPLAASLIPQAAAILAEEVSKLTGGGSNQGAGTALTDSADPELRAWIAEAAKDLVKSKGKALVLAGNRHGAAVQALALSINNALGALGSTLEVLKVEAPATGPMDDLLADLKAKKVKQLFVTAETDPAYDTPGFADAVKDSGAKLVQLAMRANYTGKIAHWVLPAAHYLEAWGDVRSSSGVYSIVQPMILPIFDGASEIDLLLALLAKKRIGPAVKPEVAAAAAPAGAPAPAGAAPAPAAPPAAAAPAASTTPEPDPSYEAVKATFAQIAGGWDEEKWNVTLRDGFLAGSAYPKASASFNGAAVAGLVAKAAKPVAPANGSVEVVLAPDSSVFDGRHLDNPWLQEAPDPITKLTWDNAAWLSVRTFRDLGLRKDGDMVTVTVGDRKLTLAAIGCPGHAHNSVTIPLGYGQKSKSIVGKGRGFDANALRGNANEFVLTGAKIDNANDKYELAITQDNYTMEARAQVREGTKERFDGDAKFAQTEGMDSHIPPNISMYQGRIGSNDPQRADYNPNGKGFDYQNEHQWGMVIDLAKCIGCSACIVACQSENNIPFVGKDQVRIGRVMQWIRMDRYFATSDDVTTDPDISELDNPEMVSQPVACQQCESAPCETVCPVNATVHTEDGLNAMAYNRCIGTRYCANNCPYTARRFNYFDYNKRNPLIETKVDLGVADLKVRNLYAGPLGEKKPQQVEQLQKNPNVTVRMRGVIEKCTYCVQRLEDAKIKQRRYARDDASKLRIPADSVKAACQASCPAEAISFGDLAHPDSTVNKWKANPRNYSVLKYLNTAPRTTYLARIRNVNKDMPVDRIVKTGEASLHNL